MPETPHPRPASRSAKPAPAPDGGNLVTGYLSERDAECPMCGYNLRSFTGTACPECGGTLQLTLRHPSALWRKRGLLLFVFTWLVLAGGMNAARAARDVHTSYNASGLFFQTLLAPTATPLMTPAVPMPAPTVQAGAITDAEVLVAELEAAANEALSEVEAAQLEVEMELAMGAATTDAGSASGTEAILFLDPSGVPPPPVPADREAQRIVRQRLGAS
ncbi:MAG: hypothetical protein ACYTF9_14160, partial [Planctomycetota bacterium]